MDIVEKKDLLIDRTTEKLNTFWKRNRGLTLGQLTILLLEEEQGFLYSVEAGLRLVNDKELEEMLDESLSKKN